MGRVALQRLRNVACALALVGGCGDVPNYLRLTHDAGGTDTGGPGSGGLVGSGGGGGGGTPVTPGSGGSGGKAGGTSTGGTASGGVAGATSSGGAGGTPGSGGVSGSGGATGGSAGGPPPGSGGTSTGGAATGGQMPTGGMPGSGGAPPTGGTPGTGGAVGGGGQPATGGASGGGGKPGTGGTGPVVFNCATSTTPSTGVIADFTSWDATASRWTSANYVSGTLFQYHEGSSTATTSVGTGNTNLHFVANITPAGSYGGGGVILDTCLAAGTNTAIQFTVTGTTTCALELQLQTYAQKPTTDAPAGGCTASCNNKYPRMSNVATSGTVKVTLANMGMWTAGMASQIVGVQWQLTVPNGSSSCTADLHLDDVKFVP